MVIELGLLLKNRVHVAFVALCILYILLRFGRRYLKRARLKIHAWSITTFSHKYNKYMGKYKEELFSDIHKLEQPIRIVEIGAGGGVNFSYYPQNCSVICVDPNPEFGKYLNASMNERPGLSGEFLQGRAEDLSVIPSESVDAVVATKVFCAIDDVPTALREIRRILKQGRKLYYMEHVCGEEKTWTYRLQKLTNPIWKLFSNNCSLTKKTWQFIEDAGFTQVQQQKIQSKMKWHVLVRPHLIGKATK